MTYINLTIIEKPKPLLMGLKVNKETLVLKNKSIQEVANLMHLTEKFVIGYDETLSLTAKPHYHIHFMYDGTLAAIQKFKQRNLKEWGTSTKLYQAKDKKESDPYCWYGYAVKENLIYASSDIDEQALKVHAHTQHAFKKSQLEYGSKKEKKKDEKKTYEQKLFEKCDIFYFDKQGFFETAKHISRISLEELDSFLTISRVEYYTWKYLLTRKHITHSQYLESHQYKFNNLTI